MTEGRPNTKTEPVSGKFDEKDVTTEVTEINKGSLCTALKKDIKEGNDSTDWYHKFTWRDGLAVTGETAAWAYLFAWKRYSWQIALPYLSGLYAASIGIDFLKHAEGSLIRKQSFEMEKINWVDKMCYISSGLYIGSGALAYRTRFMPFHTKVWGNWYGFVTLGCMGAIGLSATVFGGACYCTRNYDLWQKKTVITARGRAVKEDIETEFRKRF